MSNIWTAAAGDFERVKALVESGERTPPAPLLLISRQPLLAQSRSYWC